MPITTTPEWQRLALYTLGGITARDLKVALSPALGDIDVLGMNFLSQLASWRVEGRTLILVPPGNTGCSRCVVRQIGHPRVTPTRTHLPNRQIGRPSVRGKGGQYGSILVFGG